MLSILVFGLTACWKSPEARSAEWVAAGKASIAKKDYDRAIVELQNALQADARKVPEAYYQLGRALLPARRPRHGRRGTSESAAELQPSHAGCAGSGIG